VFCVVCVQVPSVSTGNIGAILGLKNVRTGDTLVGDASNSSLAEFGPSNITLPGISVPEPVFFCSIETDSPSQQKALEEALTWIAREDPSFQVFFCFFRCFLIVSLSSTALSSFSSFSSLFLLVPPLRLVLIAIRHRLF
jgi:hypothetical protein